MISDLIRRLSRRRSPTACSESSSSEQPENVLSWEEEKKLVYWCVACKRNRSSYPAYRWENEMWACRECGDEVRSRAERLKSLPLVEFRKLVVYGRNELFDVLLGEPVIREEVQEPGDNTSV